jgi:alkaline phosphatase
MFILFALMMIAAGCTQVTPQVVEKEVVVEKPVVQTVVVEKEVQVPVEKEVVQTVVVEKEVVIEPTAVPAKQAKYVFLFVGDGMAVAQRNAAELFKATTESAGARPERTKLLMNTFPVQGMNTTYDLKSVIPDSASTGTALATGHKTWSGVVGMDADGKVAYPNIAEAAKDAGWKVGVISSVSIDHATPASFYAHQPSRGNYHEIAMELANSGFDLYAGGPPKTPEGDLGDAIAAAEANGYSIVVGKSVWEALAPGAEKVWAMPDYKIGGNALYYDMDRPSDDVALAGYVSKAIELLDNDTGFFLMVEGGKIDWACHANDAAASIHDTIAFDNAIAQAYEFYMAHPDETLIVVTGDHETGGMTIGFAGTGYSSFVDKIALQKVSQEVFSQQVAEWRESGDVTFEDTLPYLEENFGLVVLTEAEKEDLQAKADESDKEAKLKLSMALSELELDVLRQGFADSMLGKEERPANEQTYLLYGGYEPYAMKVTTVLNQKSGISWTSYSHTGIPVQTSAIGVGAEMFGGYYDQPDINAQMMTIAGLQYTEKVAAGK